MLRFSANPLRQSNSPQTSQELRFVFTLFNQEAELKKKKKIRFFLFFFFKITPMVNDLKGGEGVRNSQTSPRFIGNRRQKRGTRFVFPTRRLTTPGAPNPPRPLGSALPDPPTAHPDSPSARRRPEKVPGTQTPAPESKNRLSCHISADALGRVPARRGDIPSRGGKPQ